MTNLVEINHFEGKLFKKSSASFLFLIKDSVKLIFHFKEFLFEGLKGVFYNFVGIFSCGLYLDFQNVIQGMGNFVACEFDLFIFKQIYSEEIANCMVLQFDAIRNTVDHLLAFENLYALLVFLFFLHLTQL